VVRRVRRHCSRYSSILVYCSRLEEYEGTGKSTYCSRLVLNVKSDIIINNHKNENEKPVIKKMTGGDGDG
jgi:hypothetical protein